MEITCDIVMDLVDVYTNKIASDDTMAAVKEHLKTCAVCRRYFDEYKKNLVNEYNKNKIFVTEKSPGLGEDVLTESMKKLSKRLKTRRTIRNITSVFAVVVSLVVLLREFLGDKSE